MNHKTLTTIRHLLYEKDVTEYERKQLEQTLFKLLKKKTKMSIGERFRRHWFCAPHFTFNGVYVDDMKKAERSEAVPEAPQKE